MILLCKKVAFFFYGTLSDPCSREICNQIPWQQSSASKEKQTNNCETLLRVTLSQSSSKAKNILNIQLKVMQHQQQYQCMDTRCYFETGNYDLWPINYCACPVLFLNQGLMQLIILKRVNSFEFKSITKLMHHVKAIRESIALSYKACPYIWVHDQRVLLQCLCNPTASNIS